MLDSDDAANSIDDHKKFDVLVEALWEVVKDYIDKWESNRWEDDDYIWERELF
jgi:hypothetical protein